MPTKKLETYTAEFKEESIEERIYTTLNNIKHPAQGKQALWDDIEKLDHVLGLLILGKKIDSKFRFLTDREYKKIYNRS